MFASSQEHTTLRARMSLSGRQSLGQTHHKIWQGIDETGAAVVSACFCGGSSGLQATEKQTIKRGALQAAEKLIRLKGTGFIPYISAEKSTRGFSPGPYARSRKIVRA
jgi:hypothetical protein